MYTGPNIVRNGLVLCLDAASLRSYPGSGTTWNDLSGNNNNGILSGSSLPVFSNSSFQFTRSAITAGNFNTYTQVVTNNTIGDDFTISSWIQTTQVGNGSFHYTLMYIVSAETGGGANDFGFGVNSSGQIAFGAGTSEVTVSGSIVNTGTWSNVSVTRVKSSGLISLYVNGSLSNSGTGNAGNTLNSNSKIKIGSGDDYPSFSFGGSIANVQIYNRALSRDEITQNFNATKTRFGL
jgi:hypothetical protein